MLQVDPKSPTLLLGFDISCQLATYEMRLPQAMLVGGNDYVHSLNGPMLVYHTSGGQADVDVDLTGYDLSTVPRLRQLTAMTTSGAWLMLHVVDVWLFVFGLSCLDPEPDAVSFLAAGDIALNGVLFGELGAVLQSDLGDITVLNSSGNGSSEPWASVQVLEGEGGGCEVERVTAPCPLATSNSIVVVVTATVSSFVCRDRLHFVTIRCADAASCNPVLLGTDTGNVRLTTNKGALSVTDTDLYNCDLIAVGDTSLIQFINITSSSVGGGSEIMVQSTSGVVSVRRWRRDGGLRTFPSVVVPCLAQRQ